jgi:hypothetical protein
MIVALDFDGVIHNIRNIPAGRKMGTPNPGTKEAVTKIYDKHSVIVHTVRATGPAQIKAVQDWLDYFDIPYDEVTNIKPNADFFVDDRAIEFRGDWKEVLGRIK